MENSPGKSYLKLGWKLNKTLTPSYWMEPDAKPGKQTNDDLVLIPADTVGTHTAIIAQSGSGKSFFLGRLIEEIIINTKSRCMIFDPNSDYRMINDVVEEKYWEEAVYDHSRGVGRLPHELNQKDFSIPWQNKTKRIFVGPSLTGNLFTQLQISLPALSIDFFADQVDSIKRSELYHCHELVKALAILLQIKHISPSSRIDILTKSERILRVARSDNDIRKTLEEEFNEDELLEKADKKSSLISSIIPFFLFSLNGVPSKDKGEVKKYIDLIVSVFPYVSPEIQRFYFGKAREFHAQGILKTKINELKKLGSLFSSPKSIEVVDLPSFPDNQSKMLALTSILAIEMERARTTWSNAMSKNPDEDERVPTFIVVDEAHNIIPKVPQGTATPVLGLQPIIKRVCCLQLPVGLPIFLPTVGSY